MSRMQWLQIIDAIHRHYTIHAGKNYHGSEGIATTWELQFLNTFHVILQRGCAVWNNLWETWQANFQNNLNLTRNDVRHEGTLQLKCRKSAQVQRKFLPAVTERILFGHIFLWFVEFTSNLWSKIPKRTKGDYMIIWVESPNKKLSLCLKEVVQVPLINRH